MDYASDHFKRIDHVEIIPSDFEMSLAFYCDVLGFDADERHPVDMPPLREIVYLTLGDTMLELLSIENPSAGSGEQWQVGYRMMALEVDDMDEALAYLGKHHIEPAWGPLNIGGSKRAEITDPDGLGIELRDWNVD